MNLTITTPPARLPVSLAEVKAQLQIDTDDYDARLAGLTAAAVDVVETFCGRALITRTYAGYLNWWPSHPRGWLKNYVELFPAGLQAVSAVTTYDDSDVATVFPATQYYVDTSRPIGRVVLRRGSVWPIPLRAANGIELQWTAGYGDNPANVPEPIRQAILITVGVLNEQRGDIDALKADTTPPIVRALLSPYLIAPLF